MFPTPPSKTPSPPAKTPVQPRLASAIAQTQTSKTRKHVAAAEKAKAQARVGSFVAEVIKKAGIPTQ